MDYYFWVSTRRLEPETREQFEQSWRPAEFPEGLVGAYVLYAEEGDEVVGISIWDSAEACDRYRRSDIEARRRDAMAPSCSRSARSSTPAASSESQVVDPALGGTHARGRSSGTPRIGAPQPSAWRDQALAGCSSSRSCLAACTMLRRAGSASS
jgi:heme-degrading monooxygenase HmoA